MMKGFCCEHSCGTGANNLLSIKGFSVEFMRFRKHLVQSGVIISAKKMTPEYKVNSCTTDTPDAYVIDPKGYVYFMTGIINGLEISILM